MAKLYFVNHPNKEPGYQHRKIGDINVHNWNRGTHHRKFIKWRGEFLNGTNNLCYGDIYFWGEYEPFSESTIISKSRPKAVHSNLKPVASIPPMPISADNTDPYVFGYFRNYCCRRGNRKYVPRDVILFGTFINDTTFELDTVLVVEKLIPISTLSPNDQYFLASIKPIICRAVANKRDTFVEGLVYHKANPNGLFSFTPCTTSLDNCKSKPTIDVYAAFGIKVLKNRYGWNPKSLTMTDNFWKEILKSVYSSGWMLGINLDIIK